MGIHTAGHGPSETDTDGLEIIWNTIRGTVGPSDIFVQDQVGPGTASARNVIIKGNNLEGGPIPEPEPPAAAGGTASAATVANNGGTGGIGAQAVVPIVVDAGWTATPAVPPAFFWGAGQPVPADSSFSYTSGVATVVKVTDDFCRGDVFKVYDFGVLLGETPFVAVGGCTEVGPEAASNDPEFSSGTFGPLPAGNHEIRIDIVINPFSGGRGYIRVDSSGPPPTDGVHVEIKGNGTVEGVEVHFNNITDHTALGVNNLVEGLTVDALWNYWGSAGGPEAPGADGVSDGVDFQPWLRGWTRQVNDEFTPETLEYGWKRFSTIQDALAAAIPWRDSVVVWPGDYAGPVLIDKPGIDLIGVRQCRLFDQECDWNSYVTSGGPGPVVDVVAPDVRVGRLNLDNSGSGGGVRVDLPTEIVDEDILGRVLKTASKMLMGGTAEPGVPFDVIIRLARAPIADRNGDGVVDSKDIKLSFVDADTAIGPTEASVWAVDPGAGLVTLRFANPSGPPARATPSR